MEGNLLFVFVGITASGKTELARHVCKKHGFLYIKSLTTRERREGEEEYIYLTHSEFEDLISNDEVLEYTNYLGNYYGKSKKSVFESLKTNHSVYTITVDQIEMLKNFYDRTIIIHVRPEDPAINKTKKRLINRNQNTHDIEERITLLPPKNFEKLQNLRNVV